MVAPGGRHYNKKQIMAVAESRDPIIESEIRLCLISFKIYNTFATYGLKSSICNTKTSVDQHLYKMACVVGMPFCILMEGWLYPKTVIIFYASKAWI